MKSRADFENSINALDVTTRKSDDGKVLTLQVVNVEPTKVRTKISRKVFMPSKGGAKAEQIKDELEWENTLEQLKKAAPTKSNWKYCVRGVVMSYTLPPYYSAIMRFEGR